MSNLHPKENLHHLLYDGVGGQVASGNGVRRVGEGGGAVLCINSVNQIHCNLSARTIDKGIRRQPLLTVDPHPPSLTERNLNSLNIKCFKIMQLCIPNIELMNDKKIKPQVVVLLAIFYR